MSRIKTLQELFKRYRRPGDIVFAILFCFFSFFLLSQLEFQTKWVARTKLYAQPSFWPAVSILGMTIFSVLHYIGSLCSPRITGRWTEVWFWLRSAEYVLYFLIYVALVPWLGYLPSTMAFALFLALRVGYRSKQAILSAVAFGMGVAIIFRAFLQVKIPSGELYNHLPDAVRAFALTYL